MLSIYHGKMTVTAEINEKQLKDLVREVQAGNEVVLTENSLPVARLVSIKLQTGASLPVRIHSLKGHSILTGAVSGAEMADELFGQK